jgi:23S rRNA (cytosine1962-C5)-methyltransferase
MGSLAIKPRARIYHGHEWVYGAEVAKLSGNPANGDVVGLRDKRGKFLGSAIYNARSQIVARRFSRQKQDLDRDFFERRIAQAREYREKRGLSERQALRVVWSESDGLPGLVVDRYGDVLVVQTLTKAMDDRLELITEALRKVFEPRAILERNDAPIRQAEGLEPRERVLHGEEPEPARVELGGLQFAVDLAQGQKTGFYLDQVDNYARVAAYAGDRRVLDMFCNQGAFGLACAKAGATEVRAVDSSQEALDAAKRNAGLNELSGIEWICENAFDFLKNATRQQDHYDLVILDPPSFTRSKSRTQDAMRGYKEIHLRSLQMMRPGDILATFTCSHHVGESEFLQAVSSASVDARTNLRLLDRLGQGQDHPVVLTMPETEYLRGYIFEVMPGR